MRRVLNKTLLQVFLGEKFFTFKYHFSHDNLLSPDNCLLLEGILWLGLCNFVKFTEMLG